MSKTIMVVDDEKRLVSLVESYLAQEGYRVVTHTTGKGSAFGGGKNRSDRPGCNDAGNGWLRIHAQAPWGFQYSDHPADQMPWTTRKK